MDELRALLSDRQQAQMQALRAALEQRHAEEQQEENGNPRHESDQAADAV